MNPSETHTTEPHRTDHRPPAVRHVSLEDLADGIGRTKGTTRNLLDKGMIPGADRKTPGLKNSPWLIRPDSASRFLAGEGRNDSTGRTV